MPDAPLCEACWRRRVHPVYQPRNLCEDCLADLWNRLNVRGKAPISDRPDEPPDDKPDRRRGRHPIIRSA